MDAIRCDTKYNRKCSTIVDFQWDYVALSEKAIPVLVSMESFSAEDVAEEYNRIKIRKRRSHTVLNIELYGFFEFIERRCYMGFRTKDEVIYSRVTGSTRREFD